ncbi:MAG: hypothetical protein J6B93_00045 [Clostridia bacterium]|nr:hypothetical protein [Clostridia bacterium]
MKKGIFAGLRCVAVFAATLLLCFALLLLSALIPNGAIEENMKASALTFKTAEAFPSSGGTLNTVSDNYADAILLGISWNMGRGDPITAILDTGYNSGGKAGANYGLYLTVFEGADPDTDYTRYAHGSAAFLRFFHLFTDIKGVKLIGGACILILLCLNLALLFIKGHRGLCAALAAAFLLIGFWNISLSLEYIPTFIIALLILPAYILLEKRGDTPLLLLSAAGGTLTAFFDFLTTETVVLLLPMAMVTAIRGTESRLGNLRENIFLYLKNVAAFLGGYGSLFIFKWAAATAVTGENKFLAALSSAGQRVNGEIEGINGPLSALPAALLANLTAALGGEDGARINYPLAIGGTLLFLGLLASFIFLFRRPDVDFTAGGLLLILAAAVPLRFMVLSNHSYLHCFFTHRALVVTIFALLAVAALNTRLCPVKKGKKKIKKRGAKG